jgi:hypothetical protein
MTAVKQDPVSVFPSEGKYLFPDTYLIELALESVKAVSIDQLVSVAVAMKSLPGNREKSIQELMREVLELALSARFWLESQHWNFTHGNQSELPEWVEGPKLRANSPNWPRG